MSQERRSRKQEREGAPKGALVKYLKWAGIVLLFVLAYLAGWYRKTHRYDSFAKCLASKHARMYGLYWCPHCIEQKQLFGESFHYVPYVECAIKGSNQMADACKIAGVKLFPSWQFDNEAPKEGVLSMDALSDKTGCSLP